MVRRLLLACAAVLPFAAQAAEVKMAVRHAWAKGLSIEGGQFGITVHSILPGRIMSEQIRRNYPEDFRKTFAETEIPLKYWGGRRIWR